MRVPCVLLLLAAGCGGGGPADTGPVGPAEDTVDDAWWDATSLVLVAPRSGAFLPLGEPATFEAHVLDAQGADSGFEGITWSSSIAPAWTPTGTVFQDASLPVGSHDVTATARLPNGDRLAATAGGILVQSPYAGIYAGTVSMAVTTDLEGTPYTASCAGSATLAITPEGDELTGDATCLLSLGGYELDLALEVRATHEDGRLDGEVLVDLGVYTVPLPAGGTVSEQGDLVLAFAGDASGFATFDGTVEAQRITRGGSSD